MRAFLITALTALGIGLAGSSAGFAAPLNGEVISAAAAIGQPVEQVHWRVWRHHHHHFFRHHRRWW
jgi:hypothetical protein